MKAYTICEIEHEWGDYWNMLASGMGYRDEDNDILNVERVGPFVPPISFPYMGVIILNNDCKDKMESLNLFNLTYSKINIVKAVKSDWHKWDWNSDEPKKYPSGGEPENYIDGKKHNPSIAKEIGVLWEIISEEIGDVIDRENKVIRIPSIIISDCFRVRDYGYTFISEKLKDWIEMNYKEWIHIEEVTVIQE